LCERLDGLPLAIELAAGRMRAMSPAELLERIDDRFHLLRASPRGREERHQTLRAAAAWSYRLLGDGERIVFERASVFPGSFDLAAAEAVCGADAVHTTEVVDHLCRLVDKSLVGARRHESGTRYRLLQTLREFAAEQLRVRGDDQATHGRHLRHYIGVAKYADRLFRGPRQLAGRQIFDEEWDNVRAAHASAVRTRDLDGAEDILAAARVYAESRIRVEVGDWAERTLAIESGDRSPRPETFGQAASWANWAGDYELACRRIACGVEGAPWSDHPSTALCWSQVPMTYPGDALIDGAAPTATAALRHLECASASFDTEQDWWVLVSLVERAMACVDDPDTVTEPASDIVRRHLGRLLEVTDRVPCPSLRANAALFEGHELMDRDPPEPRAALEAYQRAVTLTDQVDDVSLGGSARRAVALAITYQSADEDAVRACFSALRWLHDKRNWYRIWQTMESAALVLATRGDVEGAAIVLGHLEAQHAPYGREASFGFRTRALSLARGDPRANAWMARGAIIERDQLVTYALERLVDVGTEVERWEPQQL
jgi:hypothetical protein